MLKKNSAIKILIVLAVIFVVLIPFFTTKNLQSLFETSALKEQFLEQAEINKASVASKSQEKFTRKHLHLVGSSTIYPFMAMVVEDFARVVKISDPQFRAAIIEANGTGGGFKLFCSGVGEQFPDFINASRQITASETLECKKNKISQPAEINIGYDGIVLANKADGQNFSLSIDVLHLALLANIVDSQGKIIANPYRYWNEIDKSLPALPIKIYGPPASSGTRDSFVELAITEPCLKNSQMIKIYPNSKERKSHCQIIRTDDAFIEAGENDNLIVQKLINDKDALGIFGFSFLQANSTVIKAVKIDSQSPSIENIAKGTYKLARPLFVYYKKEHLPLAYKMQDFVAELSSDAVIGKNGSLAEKGLITKLK
jgi:phosphate transport system substrate-binding protein